MKVGFFGGPAGLGSPLAGLFAFAGEAAGGSEIFSCELIEAVDDVGAGDCWGRDSALGGLLLVAAMADAGCVAVLGGSEVGDAGLTNAGM